MKNEGVYSKKAEGTVFLLTQTEAKPRFKNGVQALNRMQLELKQKMFVKKTQNLCFFDNSNEICYCNIFNDKKLTIMRKF